MSKTKSYFNCTCLCLFLLLLLTFKAQAVPVGGILKFFKGLGKGTKLIKPGSKIATPGLGDDVLKRINKSEISSDLNTNTLLNKNSSKDEILNAHGIRKLDKVVDGKDVVEIAGEDLLDDNKDSLINTFRVAWWTGRVFRLSDKFNKPELDERLIIECQTDNDVFTFTALLSREIGNSSDKKIKNWFLLSRHFSNAQLKDDGSILIKKDSYYQPSMDKQELLILEDNDDYIVFSNKISTGKKFPTKYFIISSNAKFIYYPNVHGTESPEYIKNTATIKIDKSNFNCLKKNI